MSGLGGRHTLRVSRSKASQWLLLVLLTLPHLKPAYFGEIPVMDLLFNLWRVVSFAVIMARLVLVKQKISVVAALICIQQVFLFWVTLLNEGDIFLYAISAFPIISVALLYDGMRYDMEVFLSSQLFCFELVICINLITELLFPDGMYHSELYSLNWFLGYDNTHIIYFIPALMFAWLYKETTGKKFRTYFLTCTIFASALLVWSGATLVALFGMAFAYALLKNRTRLFNYFTYWSIHIFFFFFAVVLKFQNIFQWFIDGVLGKWNSLLVRMTLWDRTLKLISKSLLFGYGFTDESTRVLEGGFRWASHAHNLLLEILYQGGLVNLALWVVIVIMAGKKLYRCRNNIESKIIAVAFLGWCLDCLMEQWTRPFLVGMFIVAYYSNKDDHGKRENMSGPNIVTVNANQELKK